MAKTNPTFATPERIKIEVDQFHNAAMEQKKYMKMEMGILVRERDLLKKEVGFLERTQKYMELEKCSVEEKLGRSKMRCEELIENLGRSERRCEELETKIRKLRLKKLNLKEELNRSRRKCEELRRKEIEAENRNSEPNRDVDGLRLKKMDSAQLYESRIDDLNPTVKEKENLNTLSFDENVKVGANVGDREAMPPEVIWISDDSGGSGGMEEELMNVETTIPQVLNVNHVTDKFAVAAEEEEDTRNIPESDENGKRKANLGNGDVLSSEVCGNSDKSGENKGIGLSAEGDRELVHGGTQGDETNVDYTRPGSKQSYISDVAETQGSVQTNEGKRPEAEVRAPILRIHRNCNLIKIVIDIKMNLEKENLEKIEESCFANLLRTNEFTFQGQLIVQLLLRMDLSASTNERLVFKINNSAMEFGPSDFFHITGLRLGRLETSSLTAYSAIHQSVFRGRTAITLKDIEEAFLNINTSHEGKGELTLKLALLYFLYGTLLAKNSIMKIEAQYLHLIEDLQKFNAFPRGQLGYEFLVSSIFETRFRMDSHHYHHYAFLGIQGFCDALQAWAYEMMPSVAAHCASLVNNFENLTPWILRWSATKIFRSKDLKKVFALADLKSTKRKKEETIPEEEAKQKKRKFLCEGRDQMLHTQPSSAATPPPPSMDALMNPLHQCSRRLSVHREDEPVLDDNFPRNKSPSVEDEKAVKEAEQVTTPNRHGTSDPDPISSNKATDDSERSLPETEGDGALSELAGHNLVPDVPQLIWKENGQFELSETEYERTKALYERLLKRTKRLKLWISYANLVAFGMKEKSDLDKKGKRLKCLKDARAVFERGHSYFRTCAPELKEERTTLLEVWYRIERHFAPLGNADLIRAKLPRKLKRGTHVRNEDGTIGYEEHIEYIFPE